MAAPRKPYCQVTPPPALITTLQWKPLGLALLLLCAAISASGVASAANAPLDPDDPCFIPPVLTRNPPVSNGQPVQVKIGVLLIDVVEIDDVTESFTADLKVRVRWKDPRLSAAALGHSLEH
jgi:hypothetical protein